MSGLPTWAIGAQDRYWSDRMKLRQRKTDQLHRAMKQIGLPTRYDVIAWNDSDPTKEGRIKSVEVDGYRFSVYRDEMPDDSGGITVRVVLKLVYICVKAGCGHETLSPDLQTRYDLGNWISHQPACPTCGSNTSALPTEE